MMKVYIKMLNKNLISKNKVENDAIHIPRENPIQYQINIVKIIKKKSKKSKLNKDQLPQQNQTKTEILTQQRENYMTKKKNNNLKKIDARIN